MLRHATLAIALLLAAGAHADTTTITPTSQSRLTGPAPSTMSFPVARSGDLGYPIVVSYTTVDGTATAGVDYTATAGVVSFAAGVTDATIPVGIAANGAGTFDLKLEGAAAPGPTPSFAAPQAFQLATGFPNSVAVAIGDLNGDGRPDLAAANYNLAQVTVLLSTTAAGDATPSFTAQQRFNVSTGDEGVRIVDMNGDGRPDLVVNDRGTSRISVLLNTTPLGAMTPTFQADQQTTVGSGPIRLAIGDFNNDGKPDIVTANYVSNNVSVLLNGTAPGATVVSFSANLTFAVGTTATGVAVGDVNGDGLADIVASNSGTDDVSVLINTTALPTTTAPSFAPHVDIAIPGGSQAFDVTLADLDGDGRPDIATANLNTGRVTVLLNRTIRGGSTPDFPIQQTYDVPSLPFSITAADVNGDGRADLVTASQGGNSVGVLLNTTPFGASRPHFEPQQGYDVGRTSSGVAAGDLNGDGRPDLVSVGTDGNAAVILSTTPLDVATPQFAPQQALPAVTFAHAVAAADFNVDGRPDLVVTSAAAAGSVSVLLDDTAACAGPAFATHQDFAVGNSPYSIAVADFNGDGRPDFATGNFGDATETVRLNETVPGSSNASFGAGVSFAGGAAGAHTEGIAAGDLNGDGRPDLAVVNFTTMTVLLNTTPIAATAPTFAAFQPFAFAGTQGSAIALADVNGDGKLDVVVAEYSAPAAIVWLNTTAPGAATVTFAAASPQYFPTLAGTHAVALAIADVNGDGRADLVATNYPSSGPGANNSVSVLLNTTAAGAASATFGTQAPFDTGNYPFSVATGDLDGDGRADVIVGDYFDAKVSVLLNTTAPGATTPSLAAHQTFNVVSTPYGVAAADFNGDGRPDIAASNTAGTSVSVLLNAQTLCRFASNPATGTLQSDGVFMDGFE